MEGVKEVGPIPRGTYRIEECYLGGPKGQEKYGPDADRRHNGQEGQPSLTLNPTNGNKMAGRDGGFLIHSDMTDHQTGSAGCIIMSDQFRQWIQDNGGGDLTVVR